MGVNIETLIMRAKAQGFQDMRNEMKRTAVVAKDMQKRHQDSVNTLNTMMGPMNKLSDRISAQSKEAMGNQQQMKDFAKGHQTFGSVMAENEMILSKGQQGIRDFGTKGAKSALAIRKFTTSLRGFRMEMLGVMFFGMGVSRMFGALLRPALEVSGVFGLFTSMLQVLFLPIIEALLPLFFRLADFVFNLSDKWKMIIGVGAILGFVLGKILFLVGMMSLGIGSVILVFGSLINTVSNLFGGGALGGLVAMFAVVIPGFTAAEFVSKKLMAVWEMMKETVGPVWEPIKTKIKEAIKLIKDKLTEHGLDVDEWSDKLGGALGTGKDGLQGIWDSMKAKWDEEIGPVFDSIKESMKRISDNAPEFITGMEGVAGAIERVSKAWEVISKIPAPILLAMFGAVVGARFGGQGALFGAAAGLGAGLVVEVNKIRPARPESLFSDIAAGTTLGAPITINQTINVSGPVDNATISKIGTDSGAGVSDSLLRLNRTGGIPS